MQIIEFARRAVNRVWAMLLTGSGPVSVSFVKEGFERTGTTHGSPYNYDTHVPLVFYRWRIKHGESFRPVEITDVAPTISSLLNIPFPSAAAGNPLPELWE